MQRRRERNEAECTHHDLHIANALKGIVHSPVSHLDDHFLDGLTEVLGADTFRCSKLLGPCEFIFIDVHTNDPGCASHLTAHDNRQSNSSEAKDGASRARLHLLEDIL